MYGDVQSFRVGFRYDMLKETKQSKLSSLRCLAFLAKAVYMLMCQWRAKEEVDVTTGSGRPSSGAMVREARPLMWWGQKKCKATQTLN